MDTTRFVFSEIWVSPGTHHLLDNICCFCPLLVSRESITGHLDLFWIPCLRAGSWHRVGFPEAFEQLPVLLRQLRGQRRGLRPAQPRRAHGAAGHQALRGALH